MLTNTCVGPSTHCAPCGERGSRVFALSPTQSLADLPREFSPKSLFQHAGLPLYESCGSYSILHSLLLLSPPTKLGNTFPILWCLHSAQGTKLLCLAMCQAAFRGPGTWSLATCVQSWAPHVETVT